MDDKFLIKLALVGDKNTGKTIFTNYLNNGFEKVDFDNYEKSLGAVSIKKEVLCNNHKFIFDIWDMAGEEKYERICKYIYRDAKIIFLFYEQNNRKTFITAKRRLNLIKENCLYDVVIILIANKYDINMDYIEKDDLVTDEEALEFVDENNILFTHLSILEKNSNGVNELFEKVIKEYIKVQNIKI